MKSVIFCVILVVNTVFGSVSMRFTHTHVIACDKNNFGFNPSIDEYECARRACVLLYTNMIARCYCDYYCYYCRYYLSFKSNIQGGNEKL